MHGLRWKLTDGSMRVLMVTTFPPRRCGIGDYAFDLVSELTRDKRLHLRVLTYPDGVAEDGMPRGDFDIRRALRARPSHRDIATEIAEFKPDIVHLQSSSFLHHPSLSRAVRRSCTMPLVTTVHDAPRSWRIFYVIPSLRGIYRKSSRLIVHSRAVLQTLEDFHHIDPNKITRISHGVDTRRFHPGADQGWVRRAYGLESKRIVLFFGFLRPGKGLETLLGAWSRIQSDEVDTVVMIAGGIPTGARRYGVLGDEAAYPQKVRNLAADLHLENRVVFTGYIPEERVPGLLASADVIVLPYDGNKSQSGPFHKALSTGRPVIATAVPGFQDSANNGREAVLVPPKDERSLAQAIAVLLKDSNTAKELGDRARQLAEREHDLPVVAAATIRLYDEVLQSRSG